MFSYGLMCLKMHLPKQLSGEMFVARPTGGGDNTLFSRVGASPSYVGWDKVSAPTWHRCACGWVALLPSKAFEIVVILYSSHQDGITFA